MKRILPILLGLGLLLLAAPVLAGPKAGDVIQDLELAGPAGTAAGAYLGVPPDAASFKLSQVGGEYVLVEFFSMYCPHCQREAVRVNEVYNRLMESSWASRIKLVGVGVGNSAFEVDVFRKQYKIAFPLFADPDFKVHEAVGKVGTPYFVLLRLPGGPEGLRVLLAQEGAFGSPEGFLNEVARAVKAGK